MTAEMNRELAVLQKEETPPYFLSYSVSDVHSTRVSASFGALTNSRSSDDRLLLVSVRIGDYKLDNTHELRGDPFSRFSFRMPGSVKMAQDETRMPFERFCGRKRISSIAKQSSDTPKSKPMLQ
ncbi:hypothetical protein H8E88_19545 [candidate division KSB1 bacterium]|nr:hypothetical protein [candidate division KSB1 bacterium]